MKSINLRHPCKTKTSLAAALATTCLIISSAHAALVAKWSFEETSGTVVHDSVGSYNGNFSANGAAFVSGGISGKALSLNKTLNGFVNFGNVLPFTTGDFTIVAWIKMQAGDTTDNRTFIAKHEAGTQNGYFLDVNTDGGTGQPNKAFFFDGGAFGSGIAQAIYSTNIVNDGLWHQVVGVHVAGGNKFIYVDGAPAEASNASQVVANNAAPLLLGGVNFSGVATGLFTGLIDEVQIYNHALSSSDVDFLFNNPTNGVLDCAQTAVLLQTQLNEANATNASLQTQLNAANLSNAVLRLVIEAANANNKVLQATNAALTALNNALQGQLATVNVTISNLQSQLGSANALIASLQGQLAAANALNSRLQAQLGQITLSLGALEDLFQNQFGNPNFQIPGATLQSQVSNLVSVIQLLNHGQQQAIFLKLENLKNAKPGF